MIRFRENYYSFGTSEEFKEMLEFINTYANLLPTQDTVYELLKEYNRLKKNLDNKHEYLAQCSMERDKERIEKIKKELRDNHEIDLYYSPEVNSFVVNCAVILEFMAFYESYDGIEYNVIKAWAKKKYKLNNKRLKICLMFLMTHSRIDCVRGKFFAYAGEKPFNDYIDLIMEDIVGKENYKKTKGDNKNGLFKSI